jgi:ribose transport system substrate-binding protein
MKKTGIVLLIVLVVGLTAFSAFCAEKKSFLQGSEDEVYYMVPFVSGVEYWFPVYEMFKQAGQQLGVKTKYLGTPEYDVNRHLAVFEQVLARKPAGIFLAPINSDPFIEPINRAFEMGVPVVTFASDSPNSKRISHITSDNAREAIFAADTLAKELGGKGEVAVLENPGQDNHDRRTKGFVARIKEKHPGIKVVARAASLQDPQKAYQAVLTMAQAHPNLGAVFMPEANSAMGAAQAAKELGGKIKILNCDVNQKVLDMIKEGDIWGALNPNQGVQGYFGMLFLYLAKHSDLIDPMNDYKRMGYNPMQIPYADNGLSLVTKENADDFYWDKYLKRRGTKGIKE